ncbi:hypothetical protein [Halorientalis salina]|uniref:hypothetical protein n=1 Tax=Halorientalis salina TaxID=2932266 RepID=UPI0010AD6B32|nr:hypothetical protein [Halorientalis salina]
MGKVNIGLRGWRFDEAEVFDENGELRPLEMMEPDTRDRIVRLSTMMGEPCDACYLIHGEENIQECNVARVIYGEPLGEVLLCPDHEADFLYWFREEGGSEYAGDTVLEDEFQEWFAGGGRAPEGYGGLDHVNTDPDDLPEEPDISDDIPTLEEELEKLDDEDLDALDVNLDDLDL